MRCRSATDIAARRPAARARSGPPARRFDAAASGDYLRAGGGDRRDTGQRHRDIELLTDDLDGLGDTLQPAGAQALEVGTADHA